MRRLALTAAVLALLVVPADAQSIADGPWCTDPRWLVVTMINEGSITGIYHEIITTIDRCFASNIDGFSMTALGVGTDLYREGARTRITLWRDDDSRHILVKETIHELCAVIRDCADATADRIAEK